MPRYGDPQGLQTVFLFLYCQKIFYFFFQNYFPIPSFHWSTRRSIGHNRVSLVKILQKNPTRVTGKIRRGRNPRFYVRKGGETNATTKKKKRENHSVWRFSLKNSGRVLRGSHSTTIPDRWIQPLVFRIKPPRGVCDPELFRVERKIDLGSGFNRIRRAFCRL